MRIVCSVCAVLVAAIAAADPVETNEADQTAVAVTVYNNNLGLIRDERTFAFPEGEGLLQFSDVAEKIRPETVVVDSDDHTLQILEQNYEYDLISPERLKEKNVGRRVVLRNYHDDILFKEMEGELISVTGGPVYRIDDRIYLGHPGYVTFSDIPEDLAARPTLNWLVDAKAENHTVAVSYLTRGMSWEADYVAHLDPTDDTLDLQGWVTLKNESGATYRNALLKLVAGEVNIVPEPRRRVRADAVPVPPAEPEPEPEPMMREEAFAEYHLYTLQRPTTINQNQTKQVQLLSGEGIATKRAYEVRRQQRVVNQPGEPLIQRAAVFLEVENTEENGLGIPMPAGAIRLYQEDRDGAAQHIAETRIDHTPRNEDIRIGMGSAFDVLSQHTLRDMSRVSDQVIDLAFEVRIRNHRDNAIDVKVIEPIAANEYTVFSDSQVRVRTRGEGRSVRLSDWEIIEASHHYERKDALTVVFPVSVDANTMETITYEVRIRLQ